MARDAHATSNRVPWWQVITGTFPVVLFALLATVVILHAPHSFLVVFMAVYGAAALGTVLGVALCEVWLKR